MNPREARLWEWPRRFSLAQRDDVFTAFAEDTPVAVSGHRRAGKAAVEVLAIDLVRLAKADHRVGSQRTTVWTNPMWPPSLGGPVNSAFCVGAGLAPPVRQSSTR